MYTQEMAFIKDQMETIVWEPHFLSGQVITGIGIFRLCDK
jgi:hypothetical protein